MSHDRFARRFAAVVILVLLAVSCAAQAPRNVIIFIGDGMGIGQITAARISSLGPDGRFALDSMPVTGLVTTHSQGALVTDSAAAATALATGNKVKNGVISVTPDGAKLRTIFEVARTLGKSTGVVTTDSVTGATPAGFVAHVPSRGQENEIAAQTLAARTDVILGGGKRKFLAKPEGGRDDGRDLIDEARKRGYEIATDAATLDQARGPRILGLFADGVMTDPAAKPTLADMTLKAISAVRGNRKGYILMIEQALSDKSGHANDARGVVDAVTELDRALQAALDIARADGRTLVLVTSDHDTGGLAVKDGNKDGLKFGPAWIDGGHTGTMVALYAFGPGAERFSGTHDNTDLPKLIAQLFGAKL